MTNPDALDIPDDVLEKAAASLDFRFIGHAGIRRFAQSVITQLGLVRGDVAAFEQREDARLMLGLGWFHARNGDESLESLRERFAPRIPDPRVPAKPTTVVLSTGEWEHKGSHWRRKSDGAYFVAPMCDGIADCDTLRAFLEAEQQETGR